MTHAADIVTLPALVRGRLLEPPELSADRVCALAERSAARDGVSVLSRPMLDPETLEPTGDVRLLVLPRPDPRTLGETDPDATMRDLLALPYEDVLAYVGELGQHVRGDGPEIRRAVRAVAGSTGEARATGVLRAQLAGLLDPGAIAAAVDRELSCPEAAGRAVLDSWVAMQARCHRGATARASDAVFGPACSVDPRPQLRAVPTRQLHITAGNSPVVPVVSALWALATKGAAVIKAPSESVLGTALLAGAVARMDPDHPLTRHLSLVYWSGGDRSVEDALLVRGRFERGVVWGSQATLGDLAARMAAADPSMKMLLFGPRVGLSLIGHDALGDLPATARRAATDSMIADQAACTASLVHLVEGSEAQALAYCEELRDALATWDRALPHVLPRAAIGRLRRLRRGAFAHGTWFENGRWPHLTSTVVYMPTAFDLALHPAGRCVVVRSIASLQDAMRVLRPGIGAVGVAPEAARIALRDEIVAKGVDSVLALGEAERGYPGMPHDGVRVLGELVRWVNA
jgi:acyl-CoA reductase LuxC